MSINALIETLGGINKFLDEANNIKDVENVICKEVNKFKVSENMGLI